MVVLRKIDPYNFAQILRLSVTREQEDFVASNAFSLAQAYACPECRPLALYEGMRPVGFCMYALDADEGEYWIYRLMVDKNHQRKGYGRQGLSLLLDRIRQEANGKRVVYISFHPQNTAARTLYERAGFQPDGRMVDGETVYRLAL